MEHALAELPLAIFTTLAPMSAGAFIVIALAVNFVSFSDEQLKKLDKFTLVPLILAIVGIFASVLHLTQPLNAIWLVGGIFRSPLTNEIAIAGIFAVLAVVYCGLALLGKLSLKLRKILSIIVAIMAVVFAAFVGLAYIMNTIQSWNSPYTILQPIGFCLLGGAAMGSMVLCLSGVFNEVIENKSFKTSLLVMTVLGALVTIGALVGYVLAVNGIVTPGANGAEMVEEALVVFIVSLVAAVLTLLGELFLIFKGQNTVVSILCVVVVIAAIFCARMVFYATQISVGLP